MIVKKNIEYAGVEKPSTPKQVMVEICGLKNAVKQAEELITRLEQAMAIMELEFEIRAAKEKIKKDGYK